MSFFGFNLEKEKQVSEKEDVPVFTWGEESYDGLGDALQEGGDELNDETFGDVGTVGKDFDFSNTVLHEEEYTISLQNALEQVSLGARPVLQDFPSLTTSGPDQPLRSSNPKAESIWGDNSSFFPLPRTNGSFIQEGEQPVASSSSALTLRETSLLPIGHRAQPSVNHTGVRTLEEIEAEMRAAAQQSRARQEELLLQQKMQLEEEERQRILHKQELELQRQMLYQQEQHQLQVQQLLQQQREHQYQSTPPPRMLPASQSPRFLEHHRQLLLLQQQQEQQLHQQRLQDVQEQLRLEEMERQLLARAALQQQHRQSPNPTVLHHRQPSSLSLGDAYNHQQRPGSQSPINSSHRYSSTPQDSLVLPNHQNIQLQQRLLSEMAQAEFIRNIQGGNTHAAVEQEALRLEAMRKIFEAEKMEEKRRRKAAKIAHMSRYNDLMTQSDKDFITRIQVSQLVTQDPYADDFYAQVYGAILRSKMGLQFQDERVLKFGSGGGVGLGLTGPKGGSRRPNAMQRMEQQVERIVNNARKREEEKGLYALQSLQGALGKTSGRSYKAAPRQLLQVDTASGVSPTISPAYASKESGTRSKGAEEAAKLGREALGNAADTTNLVRKEPLTRREILTVLEHIYDLVLQMEQLRRDQPTAEEEQQTTNWQKQYDVIVDQIWDALRVMVPLETSDPHPFISLLSLSKGKKVLSRITRHLSDQRMLTLLTLLVACFHQLDVVKQAPALDYVQDARESAETERQTQAFLGSVLQCILPVVAKASLRLITGLLGLLLDRGDVMVVARSRPGLALLTLFLSRVEVIKQNMAVTSEVAELPSPEEAQQWQLVFDHLFQLLAPHFLLLFPSTRVTPVAQSLGHTHIDIIDEPVWQFLAALALHAVSEQQHILVSVLRDKILDNVASVNKGWIRDEGERQMKLANINLFLHALGLDSSQIVM